MNISPNRISQAWQNIKNPCDYLSFALGFVAYIATLGDVDLFPRAQHALQDDFNDRILDLPIDIETREVNQIKPKKETLDKASKCLGAIDSNDTQTAANLLGEIVFDLLPAQKKEINRAFRNCEVKEEKVNLVKICWGITQSDSSTFPKTQELVGEKFHLLTEGLRMIIRNTLNEYCNAYKED